MRIEHVEVLPLRLPLRSELKIARGSVGSPDSGAPHVYVRVTSDSGAVGWGEARPSHRWSYETLETVVSTLRGYLAPAIIGADPADIQGIHDRLDTDIAPGATTGQPIAKCAVDVAIHDLLARSRGVSVSELFGSRRGGDVHLTWIVSEPSPEKAAKATSEALALGYSGVKVKVGFSAEVDEQILAAVKQTAPDFFIWADANSGYNVAQARKISEACARIGIDLLEQPLPANDLLGHRSLVERSDVPIALDESVWDPAQLIQAIRLEALDTLVVKLSKMAGFHRARRCIEIARAAGVELVGSGLTESPLGFMAGVQLFSAYGVEQADLNGPGQYLADGPAWDQITIERGRATPSAGVGIGLDIDETDVRRFLRD